MTRPWSRVALLVPILLLVAACAKSATEGASPTSQTRVQGGAGSICGSGGTATAMAPSGIPKLAGATETLSGAGSTFIAPLMSLWTSEFQKAQGTQVAYQSIGPGRGVQQISAQTVDFGASDAPMKDTELAAAKGGAILHIPLIFGAVVPTYNLTGQKSGLKFTGE